MQWLMKRKQFLPASIHTNVDIKLFIRPALTSLCSWPGGCSSRGAKQLVGWEWRSNRPSQSARYIWRPKHSLRQKTESITTTTWDSAGRELQVFHFHQNFTLRFMVKTWCWCGCAASRLEAAKDDYRIHCEELEKQLIELQHRNDELTSLAEETRALQDELDVLRFVSKVFTIIKPWF